MRRFSASFLAGTRTGPLTTLLRVLLLPLGCLYGGAVALRNTMYERGVFRVGRLPIPVISVGNLTVGGTGKTPFVRMIGRLLTERGERPLVLGRGYGAKVEGGLDEEGSSLERDLAGADVLQAPDRFAAARPRLDSLGSTIAVLDDGAQALRFGRDLDIWLLDATKPFGSGVPLPAGSMREFRRGLRRADLIVLTRSDGCTQEHCDATEATVRRIVGPNVEILRSVHAPDRLGPDDAPLDQIRDRRVYLVSAIARPDSFESTVAGLGAAVVGHETFPDHHGFTAEEYARVAANASDHDAEMILCTGKDATKLLRLDSARRPDDRGARPLRFLEVAVRLQDDRADALDRAIDRVLARTPPSPGTGLV